MGTSIAVTTEGPFNPGDKSWIKNRKGLKTMRPITVDPSLFSADHVVNGRIPSGTVLALATSGGSSGFYGPYEGGQGSVNESASVKVDATGGNFTLNIDGETTANISAVATAAAVLTALLLLSNIQPGDITVTGGPGNAGGANPYVITFISGRYADQNLPDVIATGVGLTGGASTVVVTETQGAGTAPATDGRQVAKGHLFDDIEVSVLATDPKVGAALYWEGIVDSSKLPNFASTADGKGELDALAVNTLTNIRYE